MAHSSSSSYSSIRGRRVVVTGSSGFVGLRLVEMLAAAGAAEIVAFDRQPFPEDLWLGSVDELKRVRQVVGDITNKQSVLDACVGVDGVFHIAALVGPYHEEESYIAINYQGTLNAIEACRRHHVTKLVASSSPSTRMDGTDISGKTEEELVMQPEGHHLEPYSETKAMGEMAVRNACSDVLFTVALAPHQVYGPRDSLMLPNFLAAARSGKLRVLGNGQNIVSLTYVDNYCHGLLLAFDALLPHSPVLGKFLIVTDDEPVLFWEAINDAGVGLGYDSIVDKLHVPRLAILGISYCMQLVGRALGTSFRLTPFAVRMVTIDRWFDISAAKKLLRYKPLVSAEKGWETTLEWYRTHDAWWQAKANATNKRR